jgi:hypothetical protein
MGDMEVHKKTQDALIYKCNLCGFLDNSSDNLKVHTDSPHVRHNCNNKCKDYEVFESSHNILKENYERLISINKKLQSQAKDKEYALDVQIGELWGGYERTKAENIKLKDNIETRNKLWKIVLKKFDDKSEEITKAQDKPEEIKEKDKNPREEDEVLLIEDGDEIPDSNDEEEEGHDTEIIFQRFLDNQKKPGFKRTSPLGQAEQVNVKNYACTKCTFKAKDTNRLDEHMQNAHKASGLRRENNHGETKGRIKHCHFWNNVGSCHFESKNGRPCKFEHKTAPWCNFDGQCNLKLCMYANNNQNMAFLANAQRNFRSPIGHRTQRGTQSQPWVQQQREGARRPRGGNQFQC